MAPYSQGRFSTASRPGPLPGYRSRPRAVWLRIISMNKAISRRVRASTFVARHFRSANGLLRISLRSINIGTILSWKLRALGEKHRLASGIPDVYEFDSVVPDQSVGRQKCPRDRQLWVLGRAAVWNIGMALRAHWDRRPAGDNYRVAAGIPDVYDLGRGCPGPECRGSRSVREAASHGR